MTTKKETVVKEVVAENFIAEMMRASDLKQLEEIVKQNNIKDEELIIKATSKLLE